MLAVAGALAPDAGGQSFNIDFNRSTAPGNGAPASTFAGAGVAGAWNALTDSATSLALADTAGGATAASITRSGGASSGSDSPNTHTDFQFLLDDYLLATASTSITLTVSGLAAGRYRVITYAIRTASPSTISSITVAGGLTSNPQTAGGVVPVDALAEGVTHTSHLIDLNAAGSVTITVGPTTPGTSCAVNGVQLVYSQPSRLYVDASAPAGGDGLSWATAFNELQTGIASAASLSTVTEVWVARGTYRPAGPGGPRSATFVPRKRLYGGFAGSETALAQRNIGANPTVLSGDLNGDDLPGFQNRSDNCYHVVTADAPQSGSRVDGFTISGGQADGAAAADQRGGGINLIDPFLFNIDNCTLIDNKAKDDGGAIYWLPTSGSPPKTLIVSRCLIQGNRADDGGAALRMNGTVGITAHLVNCRILNNDNGFDGTVHVFNGVCNLTNCLIAGNRAANAPGVEFRGAANGSGVRNCTITQNFCPSAAGAGVLLSSVSGSVTISNTVARLPWIDGTPTSVSDLGVLGAGSYSIIRSSVTGATGSGVVAAAPMFCATLGADMTWASGDEDFSQLACSALNDQGDNSALPTDVADLDGDGNTSEVIPYDLEGAPRQVDLAGATNFNAQSAPVDLGAFEQQVDFLRWNRAAGTSDAWERTTAWTPNGTPGPTKAAYFPFVGTSFSTTANTGTDDADQLVVANWHYFFFETGTPDTIRLSPLRGPAAVFADPSGNDAYPWFREGLLDATGADIRVGDRTLGAYAYANFYRGSGSSLICRNVLVEWGGIEIAGSTWDISGEVRVGGEEAYLVGGGTISGDVVVHGLISPSNTVPPVLNITGNLTMAQSPVASDRAPITNFDVYPGGNIDQFVVGGTATLGGSVSVSLHPTSPVPPVGSAWTLLTAGARAGTFGTAFLPGDGQKIVRLVYGSAAAERSATVVAQVEYQTNVINLQPPLGFPVPGTPAAAATGKVHAAANTQPDLCVVVPDSTNPTGAPGKLHVLINLGATANAWNGWAAVTLTKTTQNNPSGACLADFNADGRKDVAVCNQSSNSVQVFLNNGADDFLAPITFATGSAPKAIDAGDIDSDGDQDLVVACSGVNQVWLHRNNGAAVFAHASPADEIAVGTDPSSVFVKDLDADGAPDIGVANRGSANASIIRNTVPVLARGAGGERLAWQGFLTPTFHACESEPSSIEPGQIDNGKDTDVVIGNHGSGSVTVLLSSDSGGFSSSSGPIGSSPSSVALVDLDQDGRLDIAAAAQDPAAPGSNVIRVLQTSVDAGGTLLLNQGANIVPDAPPTLVLADDLDGNGIADLIAVNPDTVAERGADAPPRVATNTIKVRLNLRPCPTDLSGDRVTNTGDLTLLLLRFGQAAPVGSPAAAADLNQDGTVNTADLTQLLLKFGQACPR